MPKHRAGRKMAGSHTTIIDAAIDIVDALRECPEVTKISLEIIKQIGTTNHANIKIHKIVGGLKIVVRGRTTNQEIFVYTSNSHKTEQFLRGIACVK
jgi:hypothetical protein